MSNELYGQDMLLDNGELVIAANGECVLSESVQTVLQDIHLRLEMPLGSLFYDTDFGSRIFEYKYAENTSLTRQGLQIEVSKRINMEPRVIPTRTQILIVKWDHVGIVLQAVFYLVDETNPFNLVIKIDDDINVVVKDVNTG